MITKTKMQRWMPSLLTGLALVGSASLGQAQSLITYTFDSDVQGWSSHGGGGTYSWDATGGNGGGGCLKVDFDGTTVTEIDPGVALSPTLNQNQYISVSVDIKIDPASGVTGTGGSGGYGNLQAVFLDASYSWNSIWHGTLYSPAASSGYVTYTFTIPAPYNPAEANLQFQLQGNSGTGYTAPVTVYIDNVKITPVPNPWIIDAFTDASEASSWNPQTWSGTPSASSLNTSQDAGGGFTPTGALQLDSTFANTGGYQQAAYQKNMDFDPSRFTYLEMDVKVDAANSTLANNGSYNNLSINVMDSSYSWHGTTLQLAASATSWTHVKVPMPSLTASHGFVLDLNGSDYQGPVSLYVDNVKASNPNTLPKIEGLAAAGPSGTKITLSGPGNQWDRQSICIPAGTATTVNYTWGGQTPATYSMTITNFPAPADAPGFEAHIFITSGDSGYDETVGSADWNVGNLAVLRVENGTNGGVVAAFEVKTNTPGANPINVTNISLPSLASANGTWSLNFSDDTHGSIVGPNGSLVANFTLDADTAAYFTAPATNFVQVGAFKNDGSNAGKSDNKGYTLTHVLMNNVNGTLFDDNFSAGLTNNYAWRVTSAAAITSIPEGTAFWLKWGVPDHGFTPQSAGDVTGPWGDAGITYIYTDTTGTNRLGAVPALALPAGNAAFFRLVNTNN